MNETLYKRAFESFNSQGFLKLIGAQIESVEKGRAVISLKKRPELTQQSGVLHAGVLSALADTACGYAAYTVVPDGVDIFSVEFKINLLRPAAAETILAEGRVVKAGKRLIVTEADVTDKESGALITTMTATMIPVSG
ncbi:MAG: PaaI family thioesterase [Clostridia bacterium]|nr:PaaI family thioesterase [Clostridia bacterium]